MSIYTGKNAKVALGSHDVLSMVDYSLTIESPLLKEPVFADEWVQVAGQGIKSASGSLSGLVNPDDSTGQVVIEQAVVNGTKITDFKLFTDDTTYWSSDTAADADAGVYFTNYAVTASANDIVKMSVDFEFHGSITKT